MIINKFLESVLQEMKRDEWTLVVATGCFDILTRGHVDYLKRSKVLGDYLLVGLDDDESVKKLKGKTRPINNQNDRAAVLNALRCVDYVYIFDDIKEFLRIVKPAIWVKGGDYTIDTIDQEERNIVQGYGGEVVIIPKVFDVSTTSILSKL